MSVLTIPSPGGATERRRRLVRTLGCVGPLASLAILSSCTTFGTNISGKFACGATGPGTCAPATVIDDQALAVISGERYSPEDRARPAGPYRAPPSMPVGPERIAYTATNTRPVSNQKVLRIVFPPHVDGAGRFHEKSVVRAVVEDGAWLATVEGHGPALAATDALNGNPAPMPMPGGTDDCAVARTAPGTAAAPNPASAAADPNAPTRAAVAAARTRAKERRMAQAHTETPKTATPRASVAASTSLPVNAPAAFDGQVED